jgi:hypothetical protein
MDVAEIRRLNLLGLLRDFGTLEELAEQYDLVANYLSQVKSGHRNMGARFARKLEERMGKGNGWMDKLQFTNPDDAVDGIEIMQIYDGLLAEDKAALLKHARLLGGSGPKGVNNPFGGPKKGPGADTQ